MGAQEYAYLVRGGGVHCQRSHFAQVGESESGRCSCCMGWKWGVEWYVFFFSFASMLPYAVASCTACSTCPPDCQSACKATAAGYLSAFKGEKLVHQTTALINAHAAVCLRCEVTCRDACADCAVPDAEIRLRADPTAAGVEAEAAQDPPAAGVEGEAAQAGGEPEEKYILVPEGLRKGEDRRLRGHGRNLQRQPLRGYEDLGEGLCGFTTDFADQVHLGKNTGNREYIGWIDEFRCRAECDAREECSGYSWSAYGHCLLWTDSPLTLDVFGWGQAHCMRACTLGEGKCVLDTVHKFLDRV